MQLSAGGDEADSSSSGRGSHRRLTRRTPAIVFPGAPIAVARSIREPNVQSPESIWIKGNAFCVIEQATLRATARISRSDRS